MQKYENNKKHWKYQTHEKKKSKIKKCRFGGKIGENPSLPDLPDHLIPLKTVQYLPWPSPFTTSCDYLFCLIIIVSAVSCGQK